MNARLDAPSVAVPFQKACKRCRVTKPLSCFHNEKRNSDGRTGTCKQCARERQDAWNLANPDKVRAYKRAWSVESYRSDPENSAAKLRLYREKNRPVVEAQYERRNKRLREERATNPVRLRARDTARRQATGEKMRAREAARYAVSTGALIRCPCEVCGAIKVQAHHDDYSKPLAVRWLCVTHHAAHHRGER